MVVADDAFRAGMMANGGPSHAADMLLGMFQASRRGDFAPVDPALERVLGRPTTALSDVLEAPLTAA